MKQLGKTTLTTRGDREMVLIRTFDAPRPLVFAAWTQPRLLERWMGARAGWTLEVSKFELRVGGTARYVWRGEGHQMGLTQTVLEVDPPARLVMEEIFDEPWYPGRAVSTLELVEADGKTTCTLTVRYASAEVLDLVLRFPAAEGLAEGYDRLDEVLAERR